MADKTFHAQAYPLWVVVPPDGVPLITATDGTGDATSAITQWITVNTEAKLIIGWFIGNPTPDGVAAEPVTLGGTVYPARKVKFYGQTQQEAIDALHDAIQGHGHVARST